MKWFEDATLLLSTWAQDCLFEELGPQDKEMKKKTNVGYQIMLRILSYFWNVISSNKWK